MSTDPYETLLQKFIAIVDLVCNQDGVGTPQMRQNLLRTINEFKEDVNAAKEIANALPGGRLMVDEQDDVIRMLQGIKDQRRMVLSSLIQNISSPLSIEEPVKMEIDSTASTPCGP